LIENTAGAVFTGTVVNGQAQYAQVGVPIYRASIIRTVRP
jgi:hypothetical protein